MPLVVIKKSFAPVLGLVARYEIKQTNGRESSVKMWRKHGDFRLRSVLGAGLCLALSACETGLVQSLPSITGRSSSGGIVVADEPQAALVARDVINAGGSAADGAVALGFALSVTLQSASGLGGGGLCTVFDAKSGRSEVLDFLPTPATGRQTLARWQVSVPGLARGLFALHAKYGRLPWQRVVVPAENLARFGNTVSRAFGHHLRTSSSVLVNDPEALDMFMSRQRTVLRKGERLEQLDLAATLGRIRGRTPGDFYAGALAKTIDESALVEGISLSADDLRTFAPRWREPQHVSSGSMSYHVGTSGADPSFVSEAFSNQQGDTNALQSSAPSANGFVVADADGNVVACSVTMVEPFGSGLILNGLGFLVAPSPEHAEDNPALIAAIAVDRTTDDILFAGASGGRGAIENLTRVSSRVLMDGESLRDSYPPLEDLSAQSFEESGRAQVNAVYCERGLKASFQSCSVSNDPSGFGYGLVAFGD